MYPFNCRTLVLLCLLLIATTQVNCQATRKLKMILPSDLHQENMSSLVLSALPKGTTKRPSTPSKGHSSATPTTTTLGDEKLFARHLAALDRILWSVPSPGVGH
ncbi:unnamed protein product [Amaranthus hypochondriacus]